MEVYPLVNIQKAIGNDPVIVDLPIKNCDFPSMKIRKSNVAGVLYRSIHVGQRETLL